MNRTADVSGSRQRTIHFGALVLGLVAALAGCKSKPPVQLGPPPSRFQAGELSTFHVRRVVMLPLENMTAYQQVGHEFGKLLAAELRTKGAFELVEVSRDEFTGGIPSLTRDGLFDDQLLAHLGRKYRADAVIVGKISHFHPYWPPSVSVSLHCLDARAGTVLASVDGNWDARNEFVARQAEQFYLLLHPQAKIPHGELVLQSPSYFQKFVAYQITQRFMNRSHWSQDAVLSASE